MSIAARSFLMHPRNARVIARMLIVCLLTTQWLAVAHSVEHALPAAATSAMHVGDHADMHGADRHAHHQHDHAGHDSIGHDTAHAGHTSADDGSCALQHFVQHLAGALAMCHRAGLPAPCGGITHARAADAALPLRLADTSARDPPDFLV